MSWGDEVMACGQAYGLANEKQRQVVIVDARGHRRQSEVWKGAAWIADLADLGPHVELRNGPGCRPYIRYPFTREGGCKYTAWRARDHMGPLPIQATLMEWAENQVIDLGQFALIEPNVPEQSNPNKQWGRGRWQETARHLSRLFPVVQVGPPGTEVLDGVIHIETETFLHGVAVAELASTRVLPEGGLHHAMAHRNAMGGTVVLFGGSPSVLTTGYPSHINVDGLTVGETAACGSWTECPHCARVWDKIKPLTVASLASLDAVPMGNA